MIATRLPAQARSDDAPAITLPLSHDHVFRSQINGREYHVVVALPFSYRAGTGAADTARYPVLYLLDGEVELPLFANMLRLSNRGPTGDVILVGVNYTAAWAGGPLPGAAGVAFRYIDYTPPLYRSRDSSRAYKLGNLGADGTFGGAPAFLRVLKEEIIPLVERTYRTSGDRAIHGHSLGGLFVTYALFEDPDLFSRYAITSPSYWWDDGAIYLREAAFKKGRTGLPKQVFFGVGGQEGAEAASLIWRMAGNLCYGRENGAYRGLRLTVEMFPNEYHGSAVPFSRVLKTFYPPFGPDSTAPPNPCSFR